MLLCLSLEQKEEKNWAHFVFIMLISEICYTARKNSTNVFVYKFPQLKNWDNNTTSFVVEIDMYHVCFITFQVSCET